ncbi:MAG TPA: hypothetical protein VJI46_03210 [Candidatus Nanoarchaeia archaeon]|nr:hypothetical protein [Candidatus Nanoarchaeia archaeon]
MALAKKKNILDLQHSRNLQYLNTAIIILFTYFIGVAIGFITNEISYRNPEQVMMTAIVSMIAVSTFLLIIQRYRTRLYGILKAIDELDEAE